MNRTVFFLLAVLVVLSAPGLGAAPPQFTTTLDTIWVMGDTRYLMELPASPFGVSSELVFPLQTLVEGVQFRYAPRSAGRHPWTIEASFHTNVINPIDIMQDFDWLMYPGVPKVPIVYTESPAAMRWYLAGIEAQVALSSGGWGNVALAFGYRFQFIKQEIIGYTGWTLDPNEDLVIDSYKELRNPTAHALDYQIFYNIITAGMALTLNPAPPVSVTAKAGLSVPFVSDRDDHLLRHKLSTASGVGFGGYAGLEVRYTWSTVNARLRTFAALSGSGLWLYASTLQTQYWYEGATEQPPGTQIADIDHRISTRQYQVAFILGLQF